MKKINFQPQSDYEKFGLRVYNLLVENFSTYFVGGMVRDLLMHRHIKDIDLSTAALPSDVQRILLQHNIRTDTSHQKFGVINAIQGRHVIEIATLRQDLPATNRYPKVRFVKTAKADSNRRDFTVNGLYFQPKTGKVLDYHQGLLDLQQKHIRFIGDPEMRIKEDPLRIIRALRFQMQLNFQLDKQTQRAIEKYFHFIKTLSKNKIDAEISKLPTATQQKTLRKIINSKHLTS